MAQCPMEQGQRIEIVEPLRGLAAFAVMWFHFVYVSQLFAGGGGVAAWIRGSGQYGGLGVEVFFVISGFILPYSMYRNSYRMRDFGTFVAKRVIRLDPPYLVNILLALGLWALVSLSPSFLGEPFRFEPARFFCHFGYLNSIAGYGWYNPVYWTLAIEFQYYLLLALTFPLLVHKRSAMRNAFPLVLALCAYPLPQDNLVFFWLGLFAMGMVTFQTYCQLTAYRLYVVQASLITAVNMATLGWLISVLALTVSLVIVFVRIPRIAPLAFLGSISYSLYLVHIPIGSRFINLGTRFADTLPERLVILGSSTVITIWTSYLCYRWIERPAQRWSSAIRYRHAARQDRDAKSAT